MDIERAIEILNPAHREHYDSIETVNEACRMGMEALREKLEREKAAALTPDSLTPKMVTYPIGWKGDVNTRYRCPVCNKVVRKGEEHCINCGQAILFPEARYDPESKKILLDFSCLQDGQVRSGRWIKRKKWNYAVCSQCSFETAADTYGTNFCPHCGAKMDGGETE